MKTSESQKSLVAAMLKARQSFKVIVKDKEGQAGNRKFKYAPLDAVLDAVMPALYANDLLLTQGTEGHELVTRLDHVSGEWREHRMPINEEHANMQSYGIELTYRRRYAIQPMLGIVTEDDTDGGGSEERGGVDHTDEGAQSGSDLCRKAFHSLQPDVQTHLRRKAPTIDAAAMTNAPKARDMLEREVEGYDAAMQVTVKQGLWHLLDTKTKTAIRKASGM